jgi:hypothetical protein
VGPPTKKEHKLNQNRPFEQSRGFSFPNRKTYKFTNKPSVLPVNGSKLTVKFSDVK